MENKKIVYVGSLALVWQLAAATHTVPLTAFGRLPSLEDVVISPDGTKIAFVKTNGDSRNLVVAPLSKPEILCGARVGETKLRAVEWADDDNILATVSSTSPPPFGFIGPTREWYQLVNFSISKMKVNSLSFATACVRAPFHACFHLLIRSGGCGWWMKALSPTRTG